MTTKLMKLNEVIEATKLGRASIYNYMKKGLFPKNVRVGFRSVAWRVSDIQEWIDSRSNS